MTSSATPLPSEEDITQGTYWPGPDTVVLINRPLRPDTDQAKLSRFREDRWDLNAAVFEDHAGSVTVNFGLIPNPLRETAKHYIWQLLNHSETRAMRSSTGRRSSLLTIARLVTNSLQFVLRWLAEHGVTALCQVTQELLDDYLDSMTDESAEGPADRPYQCITEIRRLWAHRDILPASMRLPDAPPWGGEDPQDLLGRPRPDRENRTRRIGEATMQLLLNWAIRFVEDFAEDILAAHAEYLELNDHTPERRRALGTGNPTRHRSGELTQKVTDYLDTLRRQGGCLPGIRRPDGTLQIRWRHLAAILDCAPSIRYKTVGQLIVTSGLPIGEYTYLHAPITGQLDGRPWRNDRIHYGEARVLARRLATACFITVAYLSGARAGEVLNLRRGCIEFDAATGLWLMRGLYFKNAEDANGNKIPQGKVRPDPWVVIEPVAHAISVMERLHPSALIFPRAIDPDRRRAENQKRQGTARGNRTIGDDLALFMAWVNAYCEVRGRTDTIPDDKHGHLAPSRFRRTLAWFIRRRPRGLIAATIQYGHAHPRMLQGYAGTYESGFPDEYAFEDWLFRSENLAEDEGALTAGEHVSGPAADAYRSRVKAATREFAGRVLTRDRQARDLVGNPLLQIHHGEGMTCVFNPATAACQLRGTANDPMVTPDLDDCRPQCPNLALTDRDIQHVKQQAAELEEVVADTLAPPLRHERERHELARLQRIIATHSEGAATR